MRRTIARALVFVVVMSAGLGVVRPSWACGCGALVTRTDSGVEVAQETSIVRYDGEREQIVMRLSVHSQAHDAAWVMPTPTRATVTLGEQAWFGQLDSLTTAKIVKRHHWFPKLDGDNAGGPMIGAAPSRVSVLSEQRLGPFQVATLRGEASAVAGWLTAHGYRLKPRLGQALAAYRGWTFTAVKLAPEKAATLTGELDPLRITFPSHDLIYPIRLSRLAKTPQAVHLYVLAPHRVTVAPITMHTTYAGRITPGQVASPTLRGLLGGPEFLTELVQQGIQPTAFTDDLHLTYAGDTPYREVEYTQGGLVMFAGVPAFLWLLGSPVLLALAVLAVLLGRRRRTAA